MTTPNKIVREVVGALRDAGFEPTVRARRKHYQIFVAGHLVATRHQGSHHGGYCEPVHHVLARAARLTQEGPQA